MTKKISIGVALTLVLAAIALTFAITMSVSQGLYNKLISDISKRSDMYSSIDDINAQIRNNYYYYSSVDNDKMNFSVSDGYVKGLGDSQSRFLTAEEYKDYKNRLNGDASGVGITTSWDKSKSRLVVTSVAEGSSASAKGVKVNDVLTKISGETVTAKNYTELLKQLSGDRLSTVSITCLRDQTPLEFSVTVGYSFVSVSHRMIGSVAYIRISAFYANTQDQLKEAISKAQEAKATGIVFDLRDCEEGLIDYAAAAVDCITPVCSSQDEVLARLIGRDGNSISTFPSSSNNLNLPMIVLVNGGTSGPAELFACDLRDFDKALLVGTQTAGIGTAQQAFTLEDGCAVILTTSKVIPYKSEPYNDVGLMPNPVVEPADDYDAAVVDDTKDAQLQEAISLLTRS